MPSDVVFTFEYMVYIFKVNVNKKGRKKSNFPKIENQQTKPNVYQINNIKDLILADFTKCSVRSREIFSKSKKKCQSVGRSQELHYWL